MLSRFFRAAAFAMLCLAATLPVSASPWAEVGDNQLRADIELLQAAGVLNGVTLQWPMPWQSLRQGLANADIQGQPASIQSAVQRLLARAEAASVPGITAWTSLDATNKSSVIYGFDGMGRGDA